MSIEQQADEVDKVKRSENGVIVNPFSLTEDHLVADADKLMGKYKISGVPIVDRTGKLVGIITNRDMRFLTDYSAPISEVMTKDNLITAPVGTSMEKAQEILRQRQIEKLPLIDENGYRKGLITIKDIEKAVQFPNSARDEKGRSALRCSDWHYRKCSGTGTRIGRCTGRRSGSGLCTRSQQEYHGMSEESQGRHSRIHQSLPEILQPQRLLKH